MEVGLLIQILSFAVEAFTIVVQKRILIICEILIYTLVTSTFRGFIILQLSFFNFFL